MPPPPIPLPGARDAKHLHLLAVFHFVVAVLSLLNALLLGVYLLFLDKVPQIIESIAAAEGGLPPELPPEMLQLGIDVATWVLAISLVYAVAEIILNTVAGFDMLKRRRRTLSMVVAALNCLSMPVGTVLGVFTFIVLSRDSVRELYSKKPDPQR